MLKHLAVTTVILAGSAHADAPRVATDILPVHGLVARVMQGVGTPDLIVDPGATPHGYALRPSKAAALESADAVFWIGPALTPWLEDAIDTLAGDARLVTLLAAEGTNVQPFRSDPTFKDDDHAEDAAESHDVATHKAHTHDHLGEDPHAWLDPGNGKLWLEVIAAELVALDPGNSDAYIENARAGQAEIDRVTAHLEALLSPVRDVPFVVFHDAYQYFETRFGLHSAGAISLADASDPGPARIATLRGAVDRLGVVCVFSEPQFNAGLVDTVFDGMHARIAILDPMGTEIEPGAGFYPALLDSLGETMASCLEG